MNFTYFPAHFLKYSRDDFLPEVREACVMGAEFVQQDAGVDYMYHHDLHQVMEEWKVPFLATVWNVVV